MLITKYAPFQNLAEFPASFRFFDDAVSKLLNEPESVRPWAPSVDILENENELVLKADLPEVKLEDISIHLENGTLTLKGERKFEKADNKSGYHRIERSYGAFARHFALPNTVDIEKVGAALKDGVLTINLPKKEIAKPRAIKVNINN